MAAKTPGEMLQALLQLRGISPTAFGKMIGARENSYQTARRWIRGKGFDRNPRNQERAATVLGVPPKFFVQPDAAEAKERDRQEVFARFCATELGQSMQEDERATLNSIQFFVPGGPTIPYYQIQLGLLRNNIPRAVAEEAIRVNERADEEIRTKKQPERPAKKRAKRESSD